MKSAMIDELRDHPGRLVLSILVMTFAWGIWSGVRFLLGLVLPGLGKPSSEDWLYFAGVGVIAWLLEDVIGERIRHTESRIAELESRLKIIEKR